MAEATVEELPPQRFYCHLCNLHFSTAADNYTCPQCADGFVEALGANANYADQIDSDEEYYDELFYLPDRRPGQRSEHSGRRRRGARASMRAPSTLDLMQDFIVNLGVGLNWGPAGNMQVILGNPGDYAWGREGLDAIVTQLLNQMDTTGPPPLSKDTIDALPKVEITQDQVDTKLQCSVCWEDFVLKETVYQLPCQHVYHETCIRRWLELHGTCPICRQNLSGNEQQANNEGEQNSDGLGSRGNNALNALQQFFQVVQNGGNVNASSSGSTSYFHSSPNDPNDRDSAL